MTDVFISHVEEDSAVVLEVAKGLEAAGYTTWYYERDSLPGLSYLVQTGQAIEQSRAVVLIVSPASLASNEVSREIVRAHEAGKSFLPVLCGITHAEFQQRQPLWREAVGSAASISVPSAGISTILPRIIVGLKSFEVQPGGRPASSVAALPGQVRVSPTRETQRRAREAVVPPGRRGMSWLERLRALLSQRQPNPRRTPQPDSTMRDLRPQRTLPRRLRTAEVPGGRVDAVHFSVTSPAAVCPGSPFVIDVWAHLGRDRKAVIHRAREAVRSGEIGVKSKGPIPIGRGTILSVRLRLEGLEIEDPEDTVLWDGEIGNANFSVTVPAAAKPGPRRGLTIVRADGLQIARIDFIIQVSDTPLEIDVIPTQEKRHRKAFASYASEDRLDVLARVQGIQKAAPALEIFLDVMSLRSGQYWEQELRRIIPSNDIFYLFWSENARRSRWVEKEWRCALETRGLDFIDPVPLVSPERVPPPPELASKHFNDALLTFMAAEKGRKRQ